MAQAGRPKVLDGEKQKLLCGLIGMGCSRKMAARHVGISESTLFRMLREDGAFAEQVHTAKLQQEIVPLRRVLEQSQTSWRAAAWILERQHPNRFGRRPAGLYSRADLEQCVWSLVSHLASRLQSEEDRRNVLAKVEELFGELEEPSPPSARVRRALKVCNLQYDRLPRERPAWTRRQEDSGSGSDGATTAKMPREDQENPPFEAGAGI